MQPETIQHIQRAARFFEEEQQVAYLVGGSTRNLLLRQPVVDWDIAVSGDAPRLARRLADLLGGFYVHMHDKASRIVLKEGEQETLDIAPLSGADIQLDLHARDFTINAIAVPLTAAAQSLADGSELPRIDPLGGAGDLAAHLLRAVDDAIFQRDPLRLLRAVRFAQRYQLTLDPLTASMMRRDASLLLQAAEERLHEELYAILRPAESLRWLRFMDEHGLFAVLFPELEAGRGMPQPGLHYWDVFDHSLETVAALEYLMETLALAPAELSTSPLVVGGRDDLAQIRLLLEEAQAQNIITMASLTTPTMKLAALLHDIGKPITYTNEDGKIRFYGHPQEGVPLAQDVLRRLATSTYDRRLVQQIVAHHMRPGQLSHDSVTERAIRRYFVDLGPAGVNVAIVSLADHLSMRGPLPLTTSWERHLAAVCYLLNRYVREREKILPPRLIRADELMQRFNLAPGPLIGQLLEYIAEAQADGVVRSKAEAIWLVEERLARHP